MNIICMKSVRKKILNNIKNKCYTFYFIIIISIKNKNITLQTAKKLRTLILYFGKTKELICI